MSRVVLEFVTETSNVHLVLHAVAGDTRPYLPKYANSLRLTSSVRLNKAKTSCASRWKSEIIIYLFTAIGLSPGDSGYFTSKQNMKLVTTKFKSGGLHEKRVVATWNVGNRLSVCL